MSSKLNRKVRLDIEAELDRWEGISYEFQPLRRHVKLTMRKGDARISTTIATTASDPRSFKNTIANIRQSLRAIGATKKE